MARSPKRGRPDYYARLAIQPMDFSAANKLGDREGNIIKYICRYDHKGDPLGDLHKARDNLDHLIAEWEAK